MKYLILFGIVAIICGINKLSWAETKAPRVRLTTNQGEIVLELNAQAAPKTTENFLSYVRDGFYDGVIFHRVIKDFMIQGGGFTPDMKQKATKTPIANEADNGLKNDEGTIAMARTNDPNSASSQFFINTVNNAYLNFKSKTPQGWGYCVFGKVVEGMETVKKIENAATTNRGGYQDVPVEPVIIEHAVIEEK